MSHRKEEKSHNTHRSRKREDDAQSPESCSSSHHHEKDHSDRKRRRSSSSSSNPNTQEIQKIKHVEIFYEKPPPGLIKAGGVNSMGTELVIASVPTSSKAIRRLSSSELLMKTQCMAY